MWILRPLLLDDAAALYEALSADDQESLQRYTADPVVRSVDEARNLIAAKLAIGSAVYFACIERDRRSLQVSPA